MTPPSPAKKGTEPLPVTNGEKVATYSWPVYWWVAPRGRL